MRLGVVELSEGGRCASLQEVLQELSQAQMPLRRQRFHCYLGKRNVFESEIILWHFRSEKLPITFSPGQGDALDTEEIFHLTNFIEGVRIDYEKDRARQTFYWQWREKLQRSGSNDYCPADARLARTRRSLPSLRAHLRKLFRPSAIQKETHQIARAAERARKAPPVRYSPGKRLLICGWYGTETLGDKAILGGVISAARDVHPGLIADLASLEPYVSQMTARQMPELGLTRILDPGEARAALSRGDYDTLVVGGGPLMSTIPWCTYLLELLAEARCTGAKTMVAGCGLGPLFVRHRNAAIKYLLELSDEVVLRDRASVARASEDLAIVRDCKAGLDPAFLWIQRNLTANQKRDSRQILLALRDWPIQEFIERERRREAAQLKAKFESELLFMIDELRKLDPSITIVPFCMHKYAVGGDDRSFYRRLLKDQPQILDRLDNRHRGPEDDLRTIASSRAILAMRFHSTVFALATRTPFLAVDYTQGGKIAGLLADAGCGDRLLSIAEFNGVEVARRLLSDKDSPVPCLDEEVARTGALLRGAFNSVWHPEEPGQQ